jgi:hypothetical protein
VAFGYFIAFLEFYIMLLQYIQDPMNISMLDTVIVPPSLGILTCSQFFVDVSHLIVPSDMPVLAGS